MKAVVIYCSFKNEEDSHEENFGCVVRSSHYGWLAGWLRRASAYFNPG